MEPKHTSYILVLQRWQPREGTQHQTIPFIVFIIFFFLWCSIPSHLFFSLCLSRSYLSLTQGGGKGEKTGELSLCAARQAAEVDEQNVLKAS